MNEEELEQETVQTNSQLENVVQQEEEEPDNIVDVNIDLYINSNHYVGSAKVNTDTEEVDLSNFDNISGSAYYEGIAICKIRDILEGQALYEADCMDNIRYCEHSGYWADSSFMNCLANGDDCFTNLTEYYDGEYYYYGDGREETVRYGYDDYSTEWRPDWFYDEDCYWCDRCDHYVYNDDWDGDADCCRWCYEEDDDGDDDHIIEDYGESHYHDPIYFGADEKDFIGLGFELEVDCSSSNRRNNGETASGLCEHCGLEEDEMRYAHDGSLDYGFEIISQPHTVRAFWDNQEKWRKMLTYLSDRHYRSHDGGTCGLHVHVSRGMFGKTKVDQDRAITKVYAFFDENWDDIVKISRRRNLHYCAKNELPYDEREDTTKTIYEKWKKRAKYQGGHGVALNNANGSTFEYRLGRGTLNAWSFFSWIDFVITITKNARRINVDKVTSNDLLSWLGGIKESTAKYIYKRGAFRKEMLALFPSIEWETDLTETNNE